MRLAWLRDFTSGAGAVIVLVGGTLGASWLAVYLAGGTRTAMPHVFYVPVVLAATRLGPASGVVAGVTAMVLCGPLMPLDVAAGSAQETSNWLLRGTFFLAVGLLAGATGQLNLRARDRELAAARLERELALERTNLVQTVSHEIRTPLTIIHGAAEMLGRPGMVDGRLAPLVGGLQRASARLGDIATVLLASAERSDEAPDLHPVECQVDHIVEESIALVPSALDRSRVRITVESSELRIVAVPEHLKVILRCLLDNALRFSPEDQPVEVVVRCKPPRLRVLVIDHGPGIPEPFLARAFEPFTQADQSTTRAHGGLGIGLYTAHKLASQLGGQLHVGPGQSVGTVATLTVPAMRAIRAGLRVARNVSEPVPSQDAYLPA